MESPTCCVYSTETCATRQFPGRVPIPKERDAASFSARPTVSWPLVARPCIRTRYPACPSLARARGPHYRPYSLSDQQVRQEIAMLCQRCRRSGPRPRRASPVSWQGCRLHLRKAQLGRTPSSPPRTRNRPKSLTSRTFAALTFANTADWGGHASGPKVTSAVHFDLHRACPAGE
jgi:hypothetical protein